MVEVKSQPTLGDFLLREGQITSEQLAEAQAEQLVSSCSLGRILVDRGFISEAARIRVLQRRYSFELLVLRNAQIDRAVLQSIPFAFAERHRVVPVRIESGGVLVVAMEDPSDGLVVEAIRRQTGWEVRPGIATIADLEAVLGQYAALAEAYQARVAALHGVARRRRGSWVRRLGWLALVDLAPLVFLAACVAFDTMGLQERLRALLLQKRLSGWDLALILGLLWGFWTVILVEIHGLFFGRESKERT